MVSTSDLTADDLVRDVVRTLEAVRRARPLVLQLSNIVVTNDQVRHKHPFRPSWILLLKELYQNSNFAGERHARCGCLSDHVAGG